MASSPESNESAPVGSWTVDKLKEFLRKHNLPVSEIKAVLVSRVRDCLEQLFSRLNSMFSLFSRL